MIPFRTEGCRVKVWTVVSLRGAEDKVTHTHTHTHPQTRRVTGDSSNIEAPVGNFFCVLFGQNVIIPTVSCKSVT